MLKEQQPNNPTTYGPWGKLVILVSLCFIHEACQEFKGCLRFKDFLQLMRLILDFQAMLQFAGQKLVVFCMFFLNTADTPRRCLIRIKNLMNSACCVVESIDQIVMAKCCNMY